MQHDSKIVFCSAAPGDIQTLRAIEYSAAQRFVSVGLTGIAAARPMDVAFLRDRIAASQVIVAQDAGRCIGFAVFAPLGERVHIEELDVLPQWAGRRIGAALLDRVAALARQRGARALVLSTFREVPWNAPYYRRLGFRDIEPTDLDPVLRKLRDSHIARGLDEKKRVFMTRELGADEACSARDTGSARKAGASGI